MVATAIGSCYSMPRVLSAGELGVKLLMENSFFIDDSEGKLCESMGLYATSSMLLVATVVCV
jgi:hypothetical protein